MKINHFGYSSGKDSTALVGWCVHESGYDPATVRVSACDTENEEPEVYEQWDWMDGYLVAHGFLPMRRLKSMGFLQLCIEKQRFPGAVSRFCTEELKLFPTKRYFEELQLDGAEIIAHSGVRKAESHERSVLQEWGTSMTFGVPERRPLLDWTLANVWGAHKKWGLRINPLYLAGRARVGCSLCIMSGKQDIRAVVKHSPTAIDKYRDWERQVTERQREKHPEISPDLIYASFFPYNKVPLAQRSKTILVRSKKSAEYMKPMAVCSIDDAVRWSSTLQGGKQGGFDFMFEEFSYDFDDAQAPCKMGVCE